MRSIQDLAPSAAWRFIILVGVVAGLGEFLGYTLRLGVGYLANRMGLPVIMETAVLSAFFAPPGFSGGH